MVWSSKVLYVLCNLTSNLAWHVSPPWSSSGIELILCPPSFHYLFLILKHIAHLIFMLSEPRTSTLSLIDKAWISHPLHRLVHTWWNGLNMTKRLVSLAREWMPMLPKAMRLSNGQQFIYGAFTWFFATWTSFGSRIDTMSECVASWINNRPINMRS